MPSSLILSDTGMGKPSLNLSDFIKWLIARMSAEEDDLWLFRIQSKTILIEPGSEVYKCSFKVTYPVRELLYDKVRLKPSQKEAFKDFRDILLGLEISL